MVLIDEEDADDSKEDEFDIEREIRDEYNI